MNRIASIVMLSLLASGGAFAADLPMRPPPQAPAAYIPPPVPVYNWSGVYLGINGGWAVGTVKYTNNFNGFSGSQSDNGGVVGGTLGANWQSGAFVFGIEGDMDWSGVANNATASICASTGTCQTGNTWLSTIRGRAGVAWDRILFYGTAGGAFGNLQTTLNGVTTTHTQDGWTAGVGVEAALAQNWTAKIEYLYVSLGSTSATGTCTTAACLIANPAGVPFSVNAGLTANLIRGGVNYKFNF
jgi:outer membrane immunogenic protein